MIFIERSKCTGCGLCIDVCPHGAIKIQDSMAVIDWRLCQECGVCAEVCPVEAIYTVEPTYANPRKGGQNMRGRGWFGRGSWGWGRGNPYPFCRLYPGLPRRWWAAPYANPYAITIPYGNLSYQYNGIGARYSMTGAPYYPRYGW